MITILVLVVVFLILICIIALLAGVLATILGIFSACLPWLLGVGAFILLDVMLFKLIFGRKKKN